jgi:antitoxin component of MazEF toxin-antitoxin module
MTFCFGKRKIQKVQYTYMLPIPADWVRNMKLKKGDELNIEMTADNNLVISPIPQARQDSEGIGSPTTA